MFLLISPMWTVNEKPYQLYSFALQPTAKPAFLQGSKSNLWCTPFVAHIKLLSNCHNEFTSLNPIAGGLQMLHRSFLHCG